MTWYSSATERRLWVATGVVVALIYSTLGLAQTLAEELRNRQLVSDVIWFGLWLVLAAVVVLGLKTRPGWAAVGVALGIVGVYALVMARMALPEERSHLVEYGVVAVLVYEALKARSAGGRHVDKPALLAVVAAAVIGATDEAIQLLLPSRVFDPRDIAFNAAAGVMAVGASVALTWTRRKVSQT